MNQHYHDRLKEEKNIKKYIVCSILYNRVIGTGTPKITSFTKLIAWQEAHKLAILIYKTTERFPNTEKYSLIDQMRRCVISIGSNIAEGFSRQSKKEKIHFYHISKGSLTELQNQLLLAKDISYLTKEEFENLAAQTVVASKLLQGLIKAMRE